MKKIIIAFVFIIFSSEGLLADNPRYIDFKMILNESDAGKKAQIYLRNKLEKGLKKIQEKQKNIAEEEQKIIQQKKIISAEEYKKKVTELRNKVSKLQKERNLLLETVSKQRKKAKSELLKNLNPIISDYMKKNTIRLVLDKKSLLLADENLDITKDILKTLNQNLKSVNLK
jgi:outer membrane protein|tara:strand:- start:7 stop:522 length:516 start_codon:yes stop_codon:yes gene_type:complete